jgi:zinc protease
MTMKKFSSLLLILTAISFSLLGQGGIPGMMDPLPLDPAVRYGTLPNGMKYYVRKNSKPEHRAELRMALNAGSTAENDDQQGLAHFCEHMAFNGTKNFKKNDLVNYLESIGTKFGAHLNAYTSFDETVYMIQIPTDADSLIDKGLLIMEEWAHNVTYDSTEIDKERGVVVEEWRLGLGAQDRMRKKYWPILFKDSRYAERLPIGKKEVLEKCSYQTLRSFYNDWYRPDLMAVIAVGDFDLDKMEKEIKSRFGAIPGKPNGKPVKTWDVPDNTQMATAIATDKEAQFTMVQLLYKQPHQITSNVAEYRRLIIENLYTGMLNQRLSELQKQENPPFVFANSSYSSMVRNKDAYVCFAAVKQDGIETGLRALVTENERVRRFGFTPSEYDRQKKELMRNMEKQFNEKDKTESRNFAMEYVSNFLEGEPAPGISYEYALYRTLMPGIMLEEVNALASRWITDGTNAVALVLGPEKEDVKMPTEERIQQIIKEAKTSELKAYVDKISNKPLLATIPTGTKVAAEKENKEMGITTWTLANGVRVNLKPTDFKNDEIQFTSYSFGGTSLTEDKDYLSAAYADGIIDESGLGEFDNVALEKMLSGKIVSCTPNIGDVTQGLSGSCSPKDLETMMQLIYLYFTAPRKDITAFKSQKEQWVSFLQNRGNSPEGVFADTVAYTMSGYNYRERPMRVGMLEEISLDRAYEIYKERFSDASGFTFTFVGNFKTETIRPLIETYLGGLPSLKRNETFKDRTKSPPKGNMDVKVRKGTEPKSAVSMKFPGDFEFNRHNRNEMNALMKLISIKLRENLREDKGGVYGVGANAATEHYPKGKYVITIGFGCAPENAEKLIAAALSEIEDVKKNGCNEINLTKVKETFIRERETYLRENNFWLGAISQSDMNRENISELLEYNKWVNSLTSDDFKRLANKYFNMTAYKRFLLLPEKAD